MKSYFKIENKKTIVFLICLAISAFMWLLIKLSKEYEIVVDIPLTFENLPADKILINKPDSLLKVKIRDNGFDLIGISIFGTSKTIPIYVDQLRTKKLSKDQSKSYILTNSFNDFLQNEFSAVKSIRILKPDSIVCIFEEQASKMVLVEPSLSIKLSSQYQIKGNIKITPDSIWIYGSKTDLEKLDSITTEKMEYHNLETSISKEAILILPENITSDIKIIQLLIDVEKFTEAEIHVPIQHHFPAYKHVKIFPNQVQIKYAVSLSNFHLIKAKQFQVIGKEDSLSVGKLNIILKQHPDNVRIIDYSPKMAEFITIK